MRMFVPVCTGVEEGAAVAGSAKTTADIAAAGEAGAAVAPSAAIGGAEATAAFGGASAENIGLAAAADASEAAAAAPGASSNLLGTVKTLAPVVSAGASLLSAGATALQKRPQAPAAPAVPDRGQAAIDPDLAAIRKKNALLFGTDSPASTDLTSGTASPTVGRATLLGGSTKLGR